MAIAASLWFDRALEGAVRGVWAELARRGTPGTLDPGVYRPHLTLGIWERMDVPAFSRALHALAGRTAPLPVTLDGVGVFDGESHVAWLRPRVDDLLTTLHCEVQAIGARHGEGAFAHQRAGEWNPHVTVAWGLPPAALAGTLALLHALPFPLPGTGAAIGIIDTPAEVELERIELRGPQPRAAPAYR